MQLVVEAGIALAAIVAIGVVVYFVFSYLKGTVATPTGKEPHPTCYTCPAPGTIRARSELWAYEPWFCAECFAIYRHLLEVTQDVREESKS